MSKINVKNQSQKSMSKINIKNQYQNQCQKLKSITKSKKMKFESTISSLLPKKHPFQVMSYRINFFLILQLCFQDTEIVG